MRVLVINLGNTSLLGGVFVGPRRVARFRAPVREAATPVGFARWVAPRVRGVIDRAGLCSVVPALTGPLTRRIERTFGVKPRLLDGAAPHGLRIGYRQPAELGTDRLAAALGAQAAYPGRNVIVVDCGTATTVTALTADGRLAGGAILHQVHLTANLVLSPPQAPAQPFENARGNTLALADETEQDVLGADAGMSQPARLICGQIED